MSCPSLAAPGHAGAVLSASTVDHLAEHGWSQQALFLPPALTLALAAECVDRAAAGELAPARIGRGASRSTAPSVRGDRIQWLQAGQSAACDGYLAIMETLRLSLNRSLYLGLHDYETHFACYAPGASYARHLDRFRDDDSRTMSVVIYLNAAWLPTDGGALRLYPPVAASQDIEPQASRLVLFLSADIPHEVLPATRDRISLAGWFRRRTS